MSAIPYTYLFSSTMNPCSLRREWIWEERPSWMCSQCGEVLRGTGSVDLFIQEKTPENTPLNMVSGCGVGVAQAAFLELLREEGVEHLLRIGRVFGPNGELLEKWRSFHSDPRVIVRGELRAGNRICPECGRCHYFAQGTRFLCPRPPTTLELYYGGVGSIIVSERIRSKVFGQNWRMLEMERLPILDEPLDGLPRVLEC
jgi:hypothetical protein